MVGRCVESIPEGDLELLFVTISPDCLSSSFHFRMCRLIVFFSRHSCPLEKSNQKTLRMAILIYEILAQKELNMHVMDTIAYHTKLWPA